MKNSSTYQRIGFILGICLFFNLHYSYSQTTIFSTANVNLRSSPTVKSTALITIPTGTSLSKYSCENGWCLVNYGEYKGYVISNYVREQENRSNWEKGSPAKYYINSAGNKIQSPTYADSPPAGATAECRDGTYSFSQSRRGTCSHHGGVKRWL